MYGRQCCQVHVFPTELGYFNPCNANVTRGIPAEKNPLNLPPRCVIFNHRLKCNWATFELQLGGFYCKNLATLMIRPTDYHSWRQPFVAVWISAFNKSADSVTSSSRQSLRLLTTDSVLLNKSDELTIHQLHHKDRRLFNF